MPDLDLIKQGEQGVRDRHGRFARGRSGNPADRILRRKVANVASRVGEAAAARGPGTIILPCIRQYVPASALSALRHPRQTQPLVEALALREEQRVVTHRLGTELGDGKMGRETPGDRADLGGLGGLPGKGQRHQPA